jgi:hypothetical protein
MLAHSLISNSTKVELSEFESHHTSVIFSIEPGIKQEIEPLFEIQKREIQKRAKISSNDGIAQKNPCSNTLQWILGIA